ncbi:YgaP family membrane protein [Marinomonas fungiae]|uniref:Inner membrane protein YgaP-like transmembrane domain-containing protein n=1 Tax=Marinomonas fungiae TaxID=1137284 RepID=A0A0K6INP3_9GAMM|nr:DUF2892 domain-containing protein [Marinomonas fungiae]CUB04706.1 Protein of unknown function (DUF2892) [Marinomonas fungiae]
MIKKNLHIWDRLARGLIGIFVISFVLFNNGMIEDDIIAGLLIFFGVLNLISLATGWCPVYSIAGISSRPKEK